MAFTLDEFNRGIEYWNRQNNYPDDFHNQFYQYISAQIGDLNRNNLFNQEFVAILYPYITRWKANRPKSMSFINQNFLIALNELNLIWQQQITPLIDNNLTNVDYNQIEQFIETLKKIKGSNSYAFPSKIAHFILPQIFPVIDNKAIQNIQVTNYQGYFNLIKRELQDTPEDVTNNLINILSEQFHPYDNYPFYTKISELCLIGRSHNI